MENPWDSHLESDYEDRTYIYMDDELEFADMMDYEDEMGDYEDDADEVQH